MPGTGELDPPAVTGSRKNLPGSKSKLCTQLIKLRSWVSVLCDWLVFVCAKGCIQIAWPFLFTYYIMKFHNIGVFLRCRKWGAYVKDQRNNVWIFLRIILMLTILQVSHFADGKQTWGPWKSSICFPNEVVFSSKRCFSSKCGMT